MKTMIKSYISAKFEAVKQLHSVYLLTAWKRHLRNTSPTSNQIGVTHDLIPRHLKSYDVAWLNVVIGSVDYEGPSINSRTNSTIS